MKSIQTSSRIAEAYDVESFRKLGHQVIDMIADQLEESISQKDAVVLPYQKPEDELKFWESDREQGNDPLEFFQKVLDHSIKVHQPRYLGHQVAVPALISITASAL